ncbi:hypothetical protein AURDEDRAFT_158470 [Auricularia subglabra TFB-10046 SS5]|nr:hypothetical protein AURDEDRAFT_158470 [Auricularia subglabra TFB-10046 SS5]
MSDFRLSFASSSQDNGSYRLMELPADLYKRVEAGESLRMIIKGRADDDAVICTEDKTYSLRAVVLSNTTLIVTPPRSYDANQDADVVIRDQVSQILELVPVVPKVAGRLNTLLRDAEYREGHEDDEDASGGSDEETRPTKRRRIKYDELKDHIQASDVELAQSLKNGRVLQLKGEMRPLERGYLAQMLKLLLNTMVAQSMSADAALVDELILSLEEHDIPRDVASQILPWFGTVSENHWAANLESIAREIGLSILQSYSDQGVLLDEFLQIWADAMSDSFISAIDMRLLEGNFIQNSIFARGPGDESQEGASAISALTRRAQLVYLPASSLPIDPAMRFNDLFIVKARWKADELAPFLADIAVDSKARDKLLLKWCRTATDPDGTLWYTLRSKHI